MRGVHLRNDIEPQVIQNNGCTKPIRIHPIIGDVLYFKHDVFKVLDGKRTYILDDHVSLIKLDGRQWWECYYYDVGEHGWVCERDNIYLRLAESDFIRHFGKIIVVGNGPYKYHEECEDVREKQQRD